MEVVSSVYILKPGCEKLFFSRASAQEIQATSAINRAFLSATPITVYIPTHN